MRTFIALAWATLLSACGSPAKPPTVDAASKRPANTARAVDLQLCQNSLHNLRLRAVETQWISDVAAAAREHLAALQKTLATLPQVSERHVPQSASSSEPPGNSVYVLRFAFGSARLDLPAELAAALRKEAGEAPLIVLRGRTDGPVDSPAESAMARARALAVRDYLVSTGIAPTRIRWTYQPVGDPWADNSHAQGRAMNRRVEIEVYRRAPSVVGEASALALPSALGARPGRPHEE